MENENLSGPVTGLSESADDDTPDDLRGITFDDWDRDFIASFEENVFNFTDDDGKNLGFILSPKGKGNPLLFSPEGKRVSPEAFRKQLTTPSPRLRWTPVSGAELQRFSHNLPSDSTNLNAARMDDIMQVLSAQPKKQLFPSEISPAKHRTKDECIEALTLNRDIVHMPWPNEGRLQLARSRFSQTLQSAVRQTAEDCYKRTMNGKALSEVVVKHPELRQALGVRNLGNLNSERNVKAGSTSSRQPLMSKSSSKSNSRRPGPYLKERLKKITKYSQIQPKQTLVQPNYTFTRRF